MDASRRDFLVALGSPTPVRAHAHADDSTHALLQPLTVVPFSYIPPKPEDVRTARKILDGAPKTTPFEVVTYLSMATDVPAQSDPARPETFRERWIHYVNPLIRPMFQDIGYAQTAGAGDCTAWCATTVSWCLKRCHYELPPDAPVARSFVSYGNLKKTPKPGDLAVFQNIDRPANGHVGFFVSESDEKVTVRSGNESQWKEKILATECGASIENNLIGDNDIVKLPPKHDRRHHLRLIGYRKYS